MHGGHLGHERVYLAELPLIPITVLAYTLLGGLKATFLASYIQTAIIFVGKRQRIRYEVCTDEKRINLSVSLCDVHRGYGFIVSATMSACVATL